MDENQNADLPIIDVLLDDEITEITLIDENGNNVRFYKEAIIPYTVDGEHRIYAILEPIDKVDGVEEGEGLVFRVYTLEVDGEDNIEIEDDFDVIEGVFEEYNKLFDEEE